MAGPLLSRMELDAWLALNPGWRAEQGIRLRREYRFGDFREAFACMVRVAAAIERLDHHPDWRNCVDRVEVTLWTHDAGGLTAKDLELAAAMDRAASI